MTKAIVRHRPFRSVGEASAKVKFFNEAKAAKLRKVGIHFG